MTEPIREEHKIACYLCDCQENLLMVAHRNQKKIVGWLFTCPICFDKIQGKELLVTIQGEEEPDDQKP